MHRESWYLGLYPADFEVEANGVLEHCDRQGCLLFHLSQSHPFVSSSILCVLQVTVPYSGGVSQIKFEREPSLRCMCLIPMVSAPTLSLIVTVNSPARAVRDSIGHHGLANFKKASGTRDAAGMVDQSRQC